MTGVSYVIQTTYPLSLIIYAVVILHDDELYTRWIA